MQFRDLHRQYERLKPEMDAAIAGVLEDAHYISGPQVKALEEVCPIRRSEALYFLRQRHRRAESDPSRSGVGPGDAVFVSDFTFFLPPSAPPAKGPRPFSWTCGRTPSTWIPTVWSAAFRPYRNRAS